MPATSLLYATAAAGSGLLGQPSAWANLAAATGAPDGTSATNTNSHKPGHQRLLLSGYDPQAAILAATGGQVPYSLDYMHVQVKFSLDSATNYDGIDVLLLAADDTPLATRPLYLDDATTGVTVVAAVNFTGHTGYADAQPLLWAELAGCRIALDVTRSGAAGVDTLRIDAVGMFVSYTVDPPVDPGEPEPQGGGVTLRAYDRDGRRLGQVPWSSLQRTIVRNEVGALTTQLPKSLLDPALLGDEVYLRVAEDGVESPDYYLIDDDGDNDADSGGTARPVAIGATGAAAILEWGEVYSWEYEHGVTPNLLGLDPTYGFASATPGKILKTFIDLAQERGCFPHLTYSFTEDVDSAGRGWTMQYARTYDVGTTIGKVLAAMAEDGWVDWEMAGFRLDLYIPDTALATDYPEVVLRLGKQVTSGPRKRTRKGARSVILAVGGEGAMIEVADPDAVARLGRREGYEGRNGITDVGTLTAATQVSLARATTASESITLELDAAMAPPIPRPGCYLRYDQRRLTPTQLEPMRVQSIAWNYGNDRKVSVELADLWVDRDVRLARRVDAILNGSSANERVPQTKVGDEKPPAIPRGLALVSAPYTDPSNGQQFAQVTATWQEVTEDNDGSPVDELKGYTIEWRQTAISEATQRVEAGAGATLAAWSPVVPGEIVEARIAAYDRWTNYSDWSPWEQVAAGIDETPPPRPTTPQVDNYLGLLRSWWDGGFVGDAGRPADLAAIEVHVSAADGFDPNEDPEATRVGTMTASGPVFTKTPYQVQQFVRLVAVDTTGNRSAPSDQASGMTGAVVSEDIFDGAIGSQKLAELAVRSVHIDVGAVNTLQVGEVSVAKLSAGILNAEVQIAGRIATALTGQRVELNSLGIFRWNAAGQLTVAIDDNGALLTGTYKTAVTGRRIEVGATGTSGRVDFYSATSERAYLRSVTEGSAETFELVRVTSGDPLKHRIALRSDGVSFYNAPTSHLFNIGDNAVGGTLSLIEGDENFSIGMKMQGARAAVILRGGSGPFTFPSGDTYSLIRMEARNASNSDYVSVWALSFMEASDARGKTEIAEVDNASLLTAVRQTGVKRYRRKMEMVDHERRSLAPGRPPPLVSATGPEEFGLIAQEAPPQIVAPPGADGRLGIHIYGMAAMNWGATRALADIVDAQAAELADLKAAVVALTKGKK